MASNSSAKRLPWWLRRAIVLHVVVLMVVVTSASCTQQNNSTPASDSAAEAPVRQRFSPSGSAVHADETIVLPVDAGPHARFVAQFFENWKGRKYKAMRFQLAEVDASMDFDSALAATPVNWNSVTIATVPDKAGSHQVSVTIEVTDIASVVVAYHFSRAENSPYRRAYSRSNPFPAKPSTLGIETFQAVTENWTVEDINGQFRIRRSRNQATDVLGYALDAGRCTFEPLDSSKEQSLLHLALVLERLSMRLGMDEGKFQNVYPAIKDKTATASRLIPGFNMRKYNLGLP